MSERDYPLRPVPLARDGSWAYEIPSAREAPILYNFKDPILLGCNDLTKKIRIFILVEKVEFFRYGSLSQFRHALQTLLLLVPSSRKINTGLILSKRLGELISSFCFTYLGSLIPVRLFSEKCVLCFTIHKSRE